MGEPVELWVLLAGIVRGFLYAAMLLAAGSALYLLMLVRRDAVAARVGQWSAAGAAVLYALAVGSGGAAMLGGGAGVIFTLPAWSFGADSSVGVSAAIGIPAMLMLLAGFARAHAAALGAGAGAAIISFLVTGHAALAEPVALSTPMVALHLAGGAFWLGALIPLRAAGDAALLTRFSARAVWAVALIVLSGVGVAVVQVTRWDALAATDYGVRLLWKLGFVAALITVAAFNRFVLLPKAKTAVIARTIVVELVLFAFILAIAASLTMVPPPRSI